MILTFQECGIVAADYNGMRPGKASRFIINKVYDFVMNRIYPADADEHEIILNPSNYYVDFTLHIVDINVEKLPLH
jgi:hypothetical protein